MMPRKWSKVSFVFQLRDEPPKTPTGEVSGTSSTSPNSRARVVNPPM